MVDSHDILAMDSSHEDFAEPPRFRRHRLSITTATSAVIGAAALVAVGFTVRSRTGEPVRMDGVVSLAQDTCNNFVCPATDMAKAASPSTITCAGTPCTRGECCDMVTGVAALPDGSLGGQKEAPWALTSVSQASKSGSGKTLAYVDEAVSSWLKSSIKDDVPRLGARGWRLVAHSSAEAKEWCIRRIKFLQKAADIHHVPTEVPVKDVTGKSNENCRVYAPGNDLLKYEYAPGGAWRNDASDGCSLQESQTGKFYFGIMCDNPVNVHLIELTQVNAKESRNQGRVEQWHSGDWRDVGELVSLPVSGTKVVFKSAVCMKDVCTADYQSKKERDWPTVCQKEICSEDECCDKKESDIKFTILIKGFDWSKLDAQVSPASCKNGKAQVVTDQKKVVEEVLKNMGFDKDQVEAVVRQSPTYKPSTDPIKMETEVRVRLLQGAWVKQADVFEGLKSAKKVIAGKASEELKKYIQKPASGACGAFMYCKNGNGNACVADQAKVIGSIDKVEEVEFKEPDVKFELETETGGTRATVAELNPYKADLEKTILKELRKTININKADLTLTIVADANAGNKGKIEVSIIPGLSAKKLYDEVEKCTSCKSAVQTLLTEKLTPSKVGTMTSTMNPSSNPFW